jgi:hypothetical protein
MASWGDIRAAALALPGAHESDMLGEPAFKVGRKGFVHSWRGRIFMKLERYHQEFLFEARPEVFTPMNAGGMRWSWVEIGAIEDDEIGELVREAWTCVVPKKISRAYFVEVDAATSLSAADRG